MDEGKEDQEEEVEERRREKRRKWMEQERLRLILAILNTILTVTRTLREREEAFVSVRGRREHREKEGQNCDSSV